jgi:predicted Zn-dependent protease
MVAAYKHLEDPDVFSIGFLSTHPDTQARIAQLTVMAREARGPYQPIALPVAWARVKRGCTK